MFWSKEDHRLHQPNYYNNFQIVQHQNGIQQATAALPPQQQPHSTPPPQLQQQHQQQQQQQQQQHHQHQQAHRPAQQIPSHYSANQQIQHQHNQWATRPPPILTTPPFFHQFPTAVQNTAQYCAAPAQYFHPQRVTQPSAVSGPSQQRPLLPPSCAMYPTLRQNVLSQPSAAIMTPTTSSAGQQIQVQYFSPAQYCQPPIGQPTYGHLITPTVLEAPVVKHRKHAIPIIDPITQENILERELRKSESASPALSIAGSTSSNTTNQSKLKSEHQNEKQEQQEQHSPQQSVEAKEEEINEQVEPVINDIERTSELNQIHIQHHDHHYPPQHPEEEEIPTAAFAEMEQTDQDNETVMNEQEEEAFTEKCVEDSQPTAQFDHVESIEAEEEVTSTVIDGESQSNNGHNGETDENQTTNNATSTSLCSTTPNSTVSAVTTPVTNEYEVESSKCSVDDDTDKETSSITEINPPAVVEVVEKPSTSNKKSTQLNSTKANKQQQTQKQKQQSQPAPATKTSSKKNKKNKRLKEIQKKQQKTELLNIETNNNTIKTTNQLENKSKKNAPSSEPYDDNSSSTSRDASKAKETANNSSDTSASGTADTTTALERNSESPTKIGAVTEKDAIDQTPQSDDNSKKLKYKEMTSEILGIEPNDDNELLFLNSSMSGYEDDISPSASGQETPTNEKTQDILFGDFSQENSTQEMSVQDGSESNDEVDDSESSLTNNPHENKKLSYTLQQLKNLANNPDSKIPPTFRGKNFDIIKKDLRGGTASSHTPYQQNQMFQQLNFKDSMNYLNRKRSKRMNEMPPYQQQYEQQMQQQRNPDIIRINLSLKDEIKLSKSENAWVPAGLQVQLKSDAENDEQILKKIRGILNKLTPENFSKLLQNASNFPITGEERMKKVMLLIFEKTVSEPNFAPTYARFCKFLFNQQNQNQSQFTAILIKRVRDEFDSNVNNAKAKQTKLKPLMEKLAAATDPKEKLELQAELDDQEYQFRRRAWGTVRFIGEMCKVGFIGTGRVCTCIENLLEHRSEEKLEYMCKLLTTIGANLEPLDNKLSGIERAKIVERLDGIFKKIERLIEEQKKGLGSKISNRVRFMMQDVLELRARSWDQKPAPAASTLPSREVSPAFTARAQPQRGARMNSGNNYMSSGGYDKRRQNNDSQKNSSQQNIDVNKLRPLFNKDETTIRLGNPSLHMWNRLQPQQQQRQLSPPTMQQNDRPQSRSLEPESKESLDSPQQVELSNDECQRLLNGLIEVTIEEETKKYWFEKWKEISPVHHSKIIYYLLAEFIHSKNMNSPTEIIACTKLFTSLMKETLLTRLSFSEGYRQFSLICEDILVDVPKCWQYVFNLLCPLLYHKLIPFDLVWNKSWFNSSVGDKFLQSMIIKFTSEFGANYMQSFWEINSLRWSVFISDERVSKFVTSNNFEFVENHKRIPPKFVHRSADQLVQRIKALLGQFDQDIDLIIDFINTNVNIDSNFINNLTMFLCDYTVIYCNTPDSSSISSNSSKQINLTDSLPSALSNSLSSSTAAKPSWKLREDLFVKKCIPLLRRCIDCKDDHEFACLDAIVERCNQLCQSPAEDLISSMLMELYDKEVISKESFKKWKQQLKLDSDDNNKLINELDAIFKKLSI